MYREHLFSPHWGWIDALFLPESTGKSKKIRCFILVRLLIPLTSQMTAVTAISGEITRRAAGWAKVHAAT